ncbi:MAG: hypothetical protein EDR02_00170 [Actinobacteria bacterium]|nr:MAG: hypothetical protein EDR02_00170 [Actinomycetota bacterium]RIK03792.1 MAG: hypothetical protein DCC48_15395 [Acidobacteriota bacterium]
MDPSDSVEEAAFGEEATAFLQGYAPLVCDEVGPSEDREPLLEALPRWQRILHDHGWAAITWPAEHGGRGLGRLMPFDQVYGS